MSRPERGGAETPRGRCETSSLSLHDRDTVTTAERAGSSGVAYFSLDITEQQARLVSLRQEFETASATADSLRAQLQALQASVQRLEQISADPDQNFAKPLTINTDSIGP
jgi:hypothetical protein